MLRKHYRSPFRMAPPSPRVLTIAFFGLVSLLAAQGADPLDFNRDIRPILSDNCFKCHGPDAQTREADLRLDTEVGAFADLGDGFFPIVKGKPDESEVIWRIETDDTEDLMPPADSELSLTDEEIAKLRQWISEGADWSQHWSFEPVDRPELPEVENASWPRNGIDHFILKRLEEEGLTPSPEADRRTLIRRLSLDLTGLPPTPAEVQAFLEDTSSNAYETLVDRLLSSPRYGETMALPWLDAARYADTDGYQNDGPRDMWRWRDWVIEAYNRNLPFDQFTIEQLAGDLLENPTLDQLIATGFNRNHRYNSEAGLVPEEFLLENAVDRVDTTSTVWMGLTMGCARCHDHKYDPFSTTEYYQLISMFDKITESGRAIKFGNSEPWIKAPTKEQSYELARFDERVDNAKRKRDRALAEVLGTIDSRALEPDAASEAAFLTKGLTKRFSFDSDDPILEASKGELVSKNGLFEDSLYFDGGAHLEFEDETGFYCHERFSISFWVKPNETNGGVILSKQIENTRRPGLEVELNGGKLRFSILTRWVAGVGSVETLEDLRAGEWTHVTLTNDGTQRAKGMKIYLDGSVSKKRILNNTNSNVIGGIDKAPFRIGKGVVGEPFLGSLDELRIYDRTLFEDEIRILAASESIQNIITRNNDGLDENEKAKRNAYYFDSAAAEKVQKLDSEYHALRLERLDFYDDLPTTMVMEEMENPPLTRIRERGVYHQYGDEVEPALPEVFSGFPAGAPRNRLGFARWLVNGEHPLTGRVAVNRYWIKYFGRGLVKTAEDFGLQGDWPSHPELLDWLADEFVTQEWDVKAMQKLIVTSATYRQQSRVTPEILEKDPENILLARGPRQRLSAHTARDQALALSGLLVERQGGPSVSPYQPDKLWDLMSNMKYKQSKGDDLYRRSLYTIWKRTVPPPSMALMDAADRESCRISTTRTNTPLQALTFLNEKMYVEAARNLGQRILRDGGSSESAQIKFGFEKVLARKPSEKEQSLLEDAYQDYRREFENDLVGAEQLVAIGESEPDPTLDPRDLAAATTLANTLLNLDETVTKE
ncbi:MAG TPA: hypothetical protein DIV79_02360 [Opitutae bacterium]|nr:hypothetical protein [Opitutaceae bacterium]HCR28846.1 hypothetical protein [Opitutae bacterium]